MSTDIPLPVAVTPRLREGAKSLVRTLGGDLADAAEDPPAFGEIEQLALRADIHPTYLSSIELGRRNPSWTVASRLAGALGLPLSALAADTETVRRVADRVQAAGVHPHDFAVLMGRRSAA
jgi:transcriptional regulator with XRE-family HTH domain